MIKHYGVNQGLPSSECYWVIQDSKGYIWIASDAGVSKYDGYKFHTYNSSKGLPDNTVFKIHEDNYGRIWFASYSGKMSYYSYKTDSIYSIVGNNTLSDLIKVVPLDFAFDEKDTLFISVSRSGYLKLSPPNYDAVKEYRNDGSYFFLRQVGNSNFIYGSGFDYKTSKHEKVPLFFEKKNGRKDIDSSMMLPSEINGVSALRASSGSYLFCDHKSLIEITNDRKRIFFDSLPYKNAGIITIYQDHAKRLWLNTHSNGTFLYEKLSKNSIPKNFLPNMSVTCVVEDSDHGIWLATLEDGVYYIPSLDFKFLNSSSGLSNDKIHSIDIYQNKLSCLSSDGYFTQLHINSGQQLTAFKTLTSSSYLLRSKNKLLICNSNAFFFDENTGKKVDFVEKSKRRYGTAGIRLKKAIDFDEKYLLGYFDGSLVKINKELGEFEILVNEGLPKIFSIYKQDNILWIGTKKGLYSYINNTMKFYGDDIPLLQNRVECMVHDGNKLFLGMRGHGVLLFEDGKIIEHYTEADGLASNLCKSIIKDSLGNIWVGTNRGISRLKKVSDNNYTINTINLTNGLISSEINQLLIHETKLYFATNKGVGIVNVTDAFNPTISIPTYIENFQVNNVKKDFTKKGPFNYDENFIKINFKGVYVKAEGDIKYKLRLEGLDTNWTYTKNTFIQYTTLPPGRYKFVVYAINLEGRLSDEPAVIEFIIETPFWRELWFYLMITVLLFILIYFIYKHRVQLVQKQEAEKTAINKRISESELKALRAQMNPHFMFNAINSIQNFVLKNDSKSAQKYLTKFARLIRSVLENSKHELVWLNKEVEALELYIELEALRASFSFDYEVIIEDSLNAENIFIPPMIIQPFIENAILHGIIPLNDRRGKLKVKFVKSGSVLKCIILDNGIGRAKAEEIKNKKQLSHQSMGMTVTQDRINILNKQSTSLLTEVVVTDLVEDGLAMGTMIEITINIKNSQND